MPELDDIVQNIALSGQDNVVEAFAEIGKAAVNAFKEAAEAGGAFTEVIGGLAAAYTGLIGVAGLWAEHSSEAVHGLELLSKQSGESVEEVSSLQGAITALGGNAENLGGAFRRMGITIANTWDQIKKEVAGAADEAISDNLKVESAEQSLFHAQQERRKAYGLPGATQAQLEHEKRLEATTKLDKAEQALAAAEKKRDEDRLNAPEAYAKAVGEIISGEKNFAEAGKDANLSVENTLKGLIINTEGAKKALSEAGEAGQTAFGENVVDQLKNFRGTLADITGAGPKTLEVLYNLADFIKNSGNEAQNQAQVMRLFGRYVGSEMLIPLSHGSEGLKEFQKQMKASGLVITEDMAKPATEFHEAFQRLSYDLATTTTQIGLMFAPTFTQGFKDLTKYIEENHQAILAWAQDMANKVTPYIQGFFDALKGLAAFLAGDQLDPESSAGKWEKTWERITNAVKKFAAVINEILTVIKEGMAAVFGGQAGDYTSLEALFGGVAVWKALGGKLGTLFLIGFVDAIGGGGAMGLLEGVLAAAGLTALKRLIGARGAVGAAGEAAAAGAGEAALAGALAGGGARAARVAGPVGEAIVPRAVTAAELAAARGGVAAGVGEEVAAGAGGAGLAGFVARLTPMILPFIGTALASAGFVSALLFAYDKTKETLFPGERERARRQAAEAQGRPELSSEAPILRPEQEAALRQDEENRRVRQHLADLDKYTGTREAEAKLPEELRKAREASRQVPAVEAAVRKEAIAHGEGLSPEQRLTLGKLIETGGKPPAEAKVPDAYAQQMFAHIQSTMAAGLPYSKEAKTYLDDLGQSAKELGQSAKGAAEGVTKLKKSWEPFTGGPELIRTTDLRKGGSLLPYDVEQELAKQKREPPKPAVPEPPPKAAEAPAPSTAESMWQALFGKPISVGQAQINAGTVNVSGQGKAPAEAAEKAHGGPIDGWGSGTSDSMLIRASKGEYVIRADGSNLGDAIQHFTGYQQGGVVEGFGGSTGVVERFGGPTSQQRGIPGFPGLGPDMSNMQQFLDPGAAARQPFRRGPDGSIQWVGDPWDFRPPWLAPPIRGYQEGGPIEPGSAEAELATHRKELPAPPQGLKRIAAALADTLLIGPRIFQATIERGLKGEPAGLDPERTLRDALTIASEVLPSAAPSRAKLALGSLEKITTETLQSSTASALAAESAGQKPTSPFHSFIVSKEGPGQHGRTAKQEDDVFKNLSSFATDILGYQQGGPVDEERFGAMAAHQAAIDAVQEARQKAAIEEAEHRGRFVDLTKPGPIGESEKLAPAAYTTGGAGVPDMPWNVGQLGIDPTDAWQVPPTPDNPFGQRSKAKGKEHEREAPGADAFSHIDKFISSFLPGSEFLRGHRWLQGGAGFLEGFAEGGLVGSVSDYQGSRSSQMVAGTANQGVAGFHQLDIRTDKGTFTAHVSSDTMEALRSSALGSKITATGSKPSWYS